MAKVAKINESPFDCCEQDNEIERLHASTPPYSVLAPRHGSGFFIGQLFMIEMTINDWLGMSGVDKTMWLEKNMPASKKSIAFRKAVYGFGRNDAGYITTITIEKKEASCPAYRAWKRMLERCYSDKFVKQNPTYDGVTVCSEWHSFMAFRGWWLENQVDGYQLDKDIIGDGKVYSPVNCIFIPHWLNNFTNDHEAGRGSNPIGVSHCKRTGRYISLCRNPITRNQEALGYFSIALDAHNAWMRRKLQLALHLKPHMDKIDARIYHEVVDIITSKE